MGDYARFISDKKIQDSFCFSDKEIYSSKYSQYTMQNFFHNKSEVQDKFPPPSGGGQGNICVSARTIRRSTLESYKKSKEEIENSKYHDRFFYFLDESANKVFDGYKQGVISRSHTYGNSCKKN